MVSVDINIEESNLVLFGKMKSINVSLSVEREDPQEAVNLAFETLELILERNLSLATRKAYTQK